MAIKESQILKLLKSETAKYDVEQAMILCQMSHFEAGLLYLHEKSKMFKPILNHFVSINDGNKVFETCQRYGDEDPNLWVDALWYFSKTEDNEKTIQILSGLLWIRIFVIFLLYFSKTLFELIRNRKKAITSADNDYRDFGQKPNGDPRSH